MKIITDISEMRKNSNDLRKQGKRISFIPTMGKLHRGHIKLIEEGKKKGEVIVSIFVNPMQFGPNEDFNGYPRDFESDAKILEDLDVGRLFYPSADIVKTRKLF
ncbi:MAG: pantoate--beta-alanine ligase [bacterium]